MAATITKERPILFSASMVRALLEGRKTQTRRIVKAQGPIQPECWDNCVVQLTDGHGGRGWYAWDEGYEDEGSFLLKCPYGQPGDRLWVKETWARHTPLALPSYRPKGMPPGHDLVYRADDVKGIFGGRWTPSLFMPRWASRLTLEITDVRVQRVEDISEADALAEGVTAPEGTPLVYGHVTGAWAKRAFLALFYDINERAPRGSNPWVWALTFKVLK